MIKENETEKYKNDKTMNTHTMKANDEEIDKNVQNIRNGKNISKKQIQ